MLGGATRHIFIKLNGFCLSTVLFFYFCGMERKKLSIGVQSFKNLIEEDYIYVDKTEIIHRLVTQGKAYFLSRPRRFGKSLLVSTLKELFSGNKALFEG